CQENENMSSDMFERLMRERREEEGSFVSKKGVDQRWYWGIHLKKQITKLKKEKKNIKKKVDEKEVEKEDNIEGVIEIEADSSITIRDSSKEDEEKILDLDFDDEDWVDWPVFVLDDNDRGEGSSK
ncbi:9243_t:CDS:2, partial [Ambispora leptoticha]